MTVYPFFFADSLSPDEALRDAAEALRSLSYMVATCDRLDGVGKHGLGVLMEALSSVVGTAAQAVEADERRMREDQPSNYELGYQIGLADGRAQALTQDAAALDNPHPAGSEIPRKAFELGAREGFAAGWFTRATSKSGKRDDAERDAFIAILMQNLPQGEPVCVERPAPDSQVVPTLTEEAATQDGGKRRAKASA